MTTVCDFIYLLRTMYRVALKEKQGAPVWHSHWAPNKTVHWLVPLARYLFVALLVKLLEALFLFHGTEGGERGWLQILNWHRWPLISLLRAVSWVTASIIIIVIYSKCFVFVHWVRHTHTQQLIAIHRYIHTCIGPFEDKPILHHHCSPMSIWLQSLRPTEHKPFSIANSYSFFPPSVGKFQFVTILWPLSHFKHFLTNLQRARDDKHSL